MKDYEEKLINELRTKDEGLSKELYEKVLDPTTVLNILIKKLQMYDQIEYLAGIRQGVYFSNPIPAYFT
jgi:hypothetical protein